MWINRKIKDKLDEAVATRPAVLLTGARQTGKSSLLKHHFPNSTYITLDKKLLAEEAKSNPDYFLEKQSKNVSIIDEVQYAPELFRELKIRIDDNRNEYGKWLLTGSQKFELMKSITESLAGRIRILHLETLSANEIRNSPDINSKQFKDYLIKGGYPELWENPKLNANTFFEDYIQTYLEHDLRQIVDVKNLSDFRRFLISCAARAGQLINFASIGKDIGVSGNTIKSWISALETSGIIYLLPPYFANIDKRIVKSPKIYFADHGLLCHLLNIKSNEAWHGSIQKGNIWENIVFCELIKTYKLFPGRNLFFYRDQNGLEMDFIIENHNELILIESKSAEVPQNKMHFNKLKTLFKNKSIKSYLACSTNHLEIIKLKEYYVYNPLLADPKFIN